MTEKTTAVTEGVARITKNASYGEICHVDNDAISDIDRGGVVTLKGGSCRGACAPVSDPGLGKNLESEACHVAPGI